MKRVHGRHLVGLAAAVVVLLASLTAPTHANAGCVSRDEYDRVADGMRLGRVHRLFDTRGLMVDGGAGGFVRYYRTCRSASVGIEYVAGADGVARVGSKVWMRDTPGLVTRPEYRKARVGMRKGRVHRIFDTRGHVIIPRGGNHPYESREYRTFAGTCVHVDFDKRGSAWYVVGKGRSEYCFSY